MQLLDHFDHLGPNGTHQCLVLEVLGRNMQSAAERHPNDRLPGSLAWEVSRQTAEALDYIHVNGTVHAGQFFLCSKFDPA